MDVDQLMIEERTDHYKKGLCFICHQQGHIGKDFPNRIRGPPQTNQWASRKQGRDHPIPSQQTKWRRKDHPYKRTRERGFLVKRPVSTSKSLTISSLLARIGAQSNNLFSVKVRKTIETQTLIDSGAGGDFLHQDFATKHKINLSPLSTPIIPWNVDGTLNIGGNITHYTYVDFLFDDWRIGTKILVTNMRKNNLILGLPWLKENNPCIDWKTGRMELPKLTHEECIAIAMRRLLLWEEMSQENTQERTTTWNKRWRHGISNDSGYPLTRTDDRKGRIIGQCENRGSSRTSPKRSQKTKNKNTERNDTSWTYELSRCLQQEESRMIP